MSEIILNGDEADIQQLVGTAVAAGAVKFAVTTARKMLREAQTQLEIVAPGKHRDSLGSLCSTLDGMIAQFA